MGGMWCHLSNKLNSKIAQRHRQSMKRTCMKFSNSLNKILSILENTESRTKLIGDPLSLSLEMYDQISFARILCDGHFCEHVFEVSSFTACLFQPCLLSHTIVAIVMVMHTFCIQMPATLFAFPLRETSSTDASTVITE